MIPCEGEQIMAEYIYGMVIGAKERILPDGRKVYEPVLVDPNDLHKFNPPGFPGWFVARPNDRVPTLMCPGDTIRLEVAGDSPVTPRA